MKKFDHQYYIVYLSKKVDWIWRIYKHIFFFWESLTDSWGGLRQLTISWVSKININPIIKLRCKQQCTCFWPKLVYTYLVKMAFPKQNPMHKINSILIGLILAISVRKLILSLSLSLNSRQQSPLLVGIWELTAS